GKRPGLAPARSYLVRRLGQRVRVARVQHDIGACLRRCQRDGPADAAAAARNEQAPAVEAEPIEHVHGKIRGLLLFCTILPVYVGLPSTVALSRSFHPRGGCPDLELSTTPTATPATSDAQLRCQPGCAGLLTAP